MSNLSLISLKPSYHPQHDIRVMYIIPSTQIKTDVMGSASAQINTDVAF